MTVSTTSKTLLVHPPESLTALLLSISDSNQKLIHNMDEPQPYEHFLTPSLPSVLLMFQLYYNYYLMTLLHVIHPVKHPTPLFFVLEGFFCVPCIANHVGTFFLYKTPKQIKIFWGKKKRERENMKSKEAECRYSCVCTYLSTFDNNE